jgi:hypothetical protein
VNIHREDARRNPVKPREPALAQLNVFFEFGGHFLDTIGRRLRGRFPRRIGRRRQPRQFPQKSLEVFGPGHEIGLAIQLQQDRCLAGRIHVRRDQPVAGHPVGPFGRRRRSLLAQNHNGFVKIAAGLGQRALAIHQSGAGFGPEFRYTLAGNIRHRKRSSS